MPGVNTNKIILCLPSTRDMNLEMPTNGNSTRMWCHLSKGKINKISQINIAIVSDEHFHFPILTNLFQKFQTMFENATTYYLNYKSITFSIYSNSREITFVRSSIQFVVNWVLRSVVRFNTRSSNVLLGPYGFAHIKLSNLFRRWHHQQNRTKNNFWPNNS